MNADIIILADSIVSGLQESLPGPFPEGEEITVERAYEVAYDLGEVMGRKIIIFPLVYSDEGPATRREGYYDVRLSIVYLYRYIGDLDDNQRVPKDWIDVQAAFVEQKLFNVLSDSQLRFGESGEYWAQNAAVTAVYDFPRLSQHKVFWSELEITFRKTKV